jgi:transposase-like protein
VKHWLWRAVDQTGMVLDVLVQKRRDKRAAKRLLRKLLKRLGRAPRVMVTDRLPSYGAAKQELMPGVEHRWHKGLNNQAEKTRAAKLAGRPAAPKRPNTRPDHVESGCAGCAPCVSVRAGCGGRAIAPG